MPGLKGARGYPNRIRAPSPFAPIAPLIEPTNPKTKDLMTPDKLKRKRSPKVLIAG